VLKAPAAHKIKILIEGESANYACNGIAIVVIEMYLQGGRSGDNMRINSAQYWKKTFAF
jgi:hypothetical protein